MPTAKPATELLKRFAATEDLVEALLNQKIVRGDRVIAEAISKSGELTQLPSGKVLIEQGASDRDVYFLLMGKLQIIINGVRLYNREPGVTVGEMSALNASITRSSTLEAAEPTVAWKISHQRLAEIGAAHPEVWHRLAVDLAGRLEQRNKYVNRANTRPVVFLISSAEALDYARQIRMGIEHYADVVPWTDEDIFKPGTYPLEALEKQVNESDFGIVLAEPDDIVISRRTKSAAPRDNVLFELGFFMSKLGRHRTMLLVPTDAEVKLPSDFKGLTPISYRRESSRGLATAVGPAIDRIITVINDLKVRASLVEAS